MARRLFELNSDTSRFLCETAILRSFLTHNPGANLAVEPSRTFEGARIMPPAEAASERRECAFLRFCDILLALWSSFAVWRPKFLATRRHRGSRPNSYKALGGEGMLALEGIRILDFNWVYAGPYACMLLGQLGAEVIKIEGHRRSDLTRRSVISSRWSGPVGGTIPGRGIRLPSVARVPTSSASIATRGVSLSI